MDIGKKIRITKVPKPVVAPNFVPERKRETVPEREPVPVRKK